MFAGDGVSDEFVPVIDIFDFRNQWDFRNSGFADLLAFWHLSATIENLGKVLRHSKLLKVLLCPDFCLYRSFVFAVDRIGRVSPFMVGLFIISLFMA